MANFSCVNLLSVHNPTQDLEKGTTVRARCFRSMKKNEEPHRLHVVFGNGSETKVSFFRCSCAAGQGLCQHVIVLLYLISHYQLLGLKSVPPIISKTSKPQVRQLNSELTKPFNCRNSRDTVTSRLPLRGSLAVYMMIYNFSTVVFSPDLAHST